MRKTLTTIIFAAGITASLMAQITWQPHSVVSPYWPNNDIKSYGGKLYVASNDGLFSSDDDGNTWNNLTSGFSGYGDLVEIQFTNVGNIFARKNSFGAVRSLDGGSTWEYDTAGVGQNYATDLLYYDGVSDKVFLGISYPKYKLYSQSPSDASWTEVTNLPNGLNNFSPTQMTRKGSKLFLTDVYKRVLESSDNGITWIQKSGTGLGNADSQVGPGRFLAIGNDLYLGCGNVWKSTDDGDNWTAIDQGFPLQSGVYVDTRCLYYDGAKLYASTYTDRKTFESTNSGTSWTDFGGQGSWYFKAMTMHNGALFGVIHSKDSIYMYGSLTTPINEIPSHTSAINIYPNPASGSVSVQNTAIGSIIKVFDIVGNLIYSATATEKTTSINTSNFANGIYLVQVEDKERTTSTKLIINR